MTVDKSAVGRVAEPPYMPTNHSDKGELVKWTGAKGSAVFCRQACHRFRLDRDLVLDRKSTNFTPDPYLKNVNFVLLNPSTADADEDDPTIRRCTGFANEWGYESLTITNLFAIRSTDPNKLKVLDYDLTAAAHLNDKAIGTAAEQANQVVVAWGTWGRQDTRGFGVFSLLRHMGIQVDSLGVTKHGFPKHPLYLRGDSIGEPYLTHPHPGQAGHRITRR